MDTCQWDMCRHCVCHLQTGPLRHLQKYFTCSLIALVQWNDDITTQKDTGSLSLLVEESHLTKNIQGNMDIS